MEKERPECPNCGKKDGVVPILYGVVTEEMAKKVADKEIRVGAYAVGVKAPDWACNNCGYTWK